jgi:hypothetical protein
MSARVVASSPDDRMPQWRIVETEIEPDPVEPIQAVFLALVLEVAQSRDALGVPAWHRVRQDPDSNGQTTMIPARVLAGLVERLSRVMPVLEAAIDFVNQEDVATAEALYAAVAYFVQEQGR